MKKTKTYIQIFLAIIISFMLVKFLGSAVFMGASPRINKKFFADLKKTPSAFISYLSSHLTSPRPTAFFPQYGQIKEVFATKTFTPVGNGVYAAEVGGIRFVKFNDSDYKTIQIITKSGKVVTLSYPKNSPPVKEILDDIKSTE